MLHSQYNLGILQYVLCSHFSDIVLEVHVTVVLSVSAAK